MRDVPLFEPGIPSGRVPGRAKTAARRLAEELRRDNAVRVREGAALTFEALLVVGPQDTLFVSVHEPDEETAVYLAPEHPDAETCSVLGSVDQPTSVAAVIRQRVGVVS